MDAYPGREPRTYSATSYSVVSFAKNLSNINPKTNLIIDNDDGWIKWQSAAFLTYEDDEMGLKVIKDWTFNNVPEGKYRIPQLLIVFLDGEGPFGDSYQMDSENNGPFG